MHGWEDLCGRYATTTSECFMHVTTDPRDRTRNASRIARLRGELGTRSVGGRKLEQWQYEVGGGARVWYAIDDTTKTVYLTHAGIGHPKATE